MTLPVASELVGLIYAQLSPDEKRLLTTGVSCMICDNGDQKVIVDHDHHTGIVRGILCGSCNVKLGYVDSFELDWLQRVADYLNNPRATELTKIVEQQYLRNNHEWKQELKKLEVRQAQLYDDIRKTEARLSKIKARFKHIRMVML